MMSVCVSVLIYYYLDDLYVVVYIRSQLQPSKHAPSEFQLVVNCQCPFTARVFLEFPHYFVQTLFFRLKFFLLLRLLISLWVSNKLSLERKSPGTILDRVVGSLYTVRVPAPGRYPLLTIFP